jgi:hypothetical protein
MKREQSAYREGFRELIDGYLTHGTPESCLSRPAAVGQ